MPLLVGAGKGRHRTLHKRRQCITNRLLNELRNVNSRRII